jgi:hypothetical protein
MTPQSSNSPLIGLLNSASPVTYRFNADAFREGLTQAGFVEGRNVQIEERWANGDYNALPALARELVAKDPVLLVRFNPAQPPPFALKRPPQAAVPWLLPPATVASILKHQHASVADGISRRTRGTPSG